MRTMNIGKLNKRITLLRLGDVEDSLGQSTKDLVEIATVWGSLYPVRGAEFYEVQKIQSKITHKCYIRYREEIDSNCFLRCQGITYSIESATDVDLDHKMIEIMCSEHINKEMIADHVDPVPVTPPVDPAAEEDEEEVTDDGSGDND